MKRYEVTYVVSEAITTEVEADSESDAIALAYLNAIDWTNDANKTIDVLDAEELDDD